MRSLGAGTIVYLVCEPGKELNDVDLADVMKYEFRFLRVNVAVAFGEGGMKK